MATEMKTLVCPGPPEHEFQIPKGRGRPPRYCDEHKPDGKQEESKVSEETRKAPTRKRPGSKSEEKTETRQGPPRRAPRIQPPGEKDAKDDPIDEKDQSGNATMTNEGIRKLPRPGSADTKSRAKAEAAADRHEAQQTEDAIPRGIKGRPMVRIDFSASELIPTGQYANVAVGPARVQAWIDLDRPVEEDESFFMEHERANLVKALNELAETVEGDVVAVQRNIVLESMQEQRQNGNS